MAWIGTLHIEPSQQGAACHAMDTPDTPHCPSISIHNGEIGPPPPHPSGALGGPPWQAVGSWGRLGWGKKKGTDPAPAMVGGGRNDPVAPVR